MRALSLAIVAAAVEPLRVFHVPRTGSSFAPQVWAVACDLPKTQGLRLEARHTKMPNHGAGGHACARYLGGNARLEADFHHAPLASVADAAAAAGLFRDPAARIASAYDYGMHIHAPSKSSANLALKARLARLPASRRLLAFARAPQVRNTHAKMLTGRAPGDATATSVTAALARLRAMRFVGLTECFAESVALFRAAVGAGRRRASAGDPAARARNVARVAADLRSRPPDASDADVAVYACAACLFHARRRARGIAANSTTCRDSARDHEPDRCDNDARTLNFTMQI